MGKKSNWFIAVKKAFSPESKEKKDKRSNKSKKWFGKEHHQDPIAFSLETVTASPPAPSTPQLPPPPPPPSHPRLPSEELKLTEAENEQNKHAYSVALATAAAAEAAVAAAQAAAEIVRLTTAARFSGKSKEEVAAIKIQTAFRGYLARRALRALRGLVRLKSLIDGHAVKRQATTTLRSMQTLARVQSQIRARRIRMLEENQALQRQLQQKREKELARAAMAEEWDDSVQSKEQVEANLVNRQDAAMRRERALAYAYTRQQMWKNSSRSANPTFMDPNNPHWGWSWLERWMAARPWESKSMTEKEFNDHSSVKSVSRSVGGEISKAYARRELNAEKPSPTAPKPSQPPSHQSPSTPPSKAASSSPAAGKLKAASPRVNAASPRGNTASPRGSAASPRGNMWIQDYDSRSMLSMQSERPRRHSIASSSMRDDESLASSPSVPSYMAPTKSARAKSAKARLHSPLAVENNGTPERGLTGSTKKRLSFSVSPAGSRRHSGPPKVDSSSGKGSGKNTGHVASNGG
ncbi:protein IQ-DOMAIN 3-like [Macadamia integrifolia]|uniref:protein IQ-DOMAIN 3-like n=1 Tax=Macadamia integrifolia TaxID=60698 RepID=UPI001C528EE6|nr:protein IQ-DOMAIN 3-like [Macadamia integrifolia]XP_042476903.1 protein IQ-DOMAIN 3-like [Macadamia integrifolia]XP_042476904.1 protein IQ-DOMAIN 3-like [Macadamia integrifolia]